MPVHHRLRLLTFPMRASRLCSLWPDMRPLRFRRVPFGRDVAFDPGGATAPRITMPHMLPSTVMSVSASAKLLHFVAQSHTPSRSLCTLRIRRRRRLRNTRYPAARYRLTGAGLSPAGSRQLRLTHRNRKFESISLQQTVRVSPRPGRCRSKNPRFRAGVRRWGRQRRAGLVEIAQSGAVISVGRYSSTAVPLMSSGNGGPRPSPSSGWGQFLKQSRAGRVARARPAADVSGRAACLP